MFWVDLSAAGLIDGGFNTTTATSVANNFSGTAVAQILPAAKIGGGNYVYIYPCITSSIYGCNNAPAPNYFGISVVSAISNGFIDSTTGMTVAQAHAIDSKVDDGLPETGNVLASFIDYSQGDTSPIYPNGAGPANDGTIYTTGSSVSCFDWRGIGSQYGVAATAQYSMEISNGADVNCALSFKMQAGD